MRLFGQRWQLRAGNSLVIADNACSWALWAQERFIVNGEVVRASEGFFRMSASAKVPWLTTVEDSTLEVRLKSVMSGIACSAFLDQSPLMPEAVYVAQWSGARRSWPDDDEWSAEAPLRWVAFLPGQKEAIEG